MWIKDLTEEQIIDVLKSMPAKKVAERYDCSQSYVFTLRKKYGITHERRKPFAGLSDEEMRELLTKNSLNTIVKKYRVSTTTVSNLRKKYNVTKRAKPLFEGMPDEEVIAILQNHTMKELCDMYGATYQRIRNYLEMYDVKPKGSHKRKNPDTTICWDCKNALCRCPWSQSFKPVKGWVAQPTKIKDAKGLIIQSYKVLECPMFEEG